LKERAAQRGAHPRGADGGDARTESSVEEGFRWRKTGEVDAWAMGMKARPSGVDGRGKWRAGEEKDRPAAGGSILRGAAGMGARRGGRRVEAERKREREREGALGAAWSSAAACRRCGSGPAAARAGIALPRDSGGR
jgi:hypothetical protein